MQVNSGIQAKYDTQYARGVSAWRDLTGKPKAERVIKLATSRELTPARLLDVSCGEGSMLMHLDRAGFCTEMHALDISSSAISAVQDRQLANLRTSQTFDGYRIPFPDKHFDLVTCSHVIEHVEFERLLLREIARVTKFAIIEVPIDFRSQADNRIEHFLAYGHINMYSPTTFRFLLKTDGFKIINEIVDITSPEISCFNYFRNAKIEPETPENVDKKMKDWNRVADDFRSKDARAQEAIASEFAVLVDCSACGIRIF